MKNIFSILYAVIAVTLLSVALFSDPETGSLGVSVSEFASVVAVLLLASFAFKKKAGHAYEVITIEDARVIFTNAVVAVYNQRVPVTAFLRSFFPPVYSRTKYITVGVKKGTEKVAVDVLRGTGPNKNKKTLAKELTMLPPYFNEAFNVNELDIYDRAFGLERNPNDIADIAAQSAEMIMDITDKIERAYELMCSQVLQSGVVTLVNGDTINFGRAAGSLVDLGAGNYWGTTTVNPRNAIEAAAEYLRTVGKAPGSVYNVIMGSAAYNAMINNPVFQNAQRDMMKIDQGEILLPQRTSLGATIHGRISAGMYLFNIWTYPSYIEDAAGNQTPYIDPKNMIVLPENPAFVMAFAQVPILINDPANRGTMGGAYVMREYIDQVHQNHVTEIKSAGIPVPVAVDQIYTAKVVA